MKQVSALDVKMDGFAQVKRRTLVLAGHRVNARSKERTLFKNHLNQKFKLMVKGLGIYFIL